MIIWLTGQPGSGKTTICEEILRLRDHRVFHIDGDDLRDLFENKDYSETGRRKNIELAQQIAQYLHNQGKDVLVSLVSPYKDQRDRFKEKMGENLVQKIAEDLGITSKIRVTMGSGAYSSKINPNLIVGLNFVMIYLRIYLKNFRDNYF